MSVCNIKIIAFYLLHRYMYVTGKLSTSLDSIICGEIVNCQNMHIAYNLMFYF